MIFDRTRSTGRLICKLLERCVKDPDFKKFSLEENVPIPLELESGDYFIGYCKHIKKNSKSNRIQKSIPQWGMMFRPKTNGDDMLYIGGFNDEGISENQQGLLFNDINFSDGYLNYFTSRNNLEKFKSNFKGSVHDFDMQGEGLYNWAKSEPKAIDLPLKCTKTSKIWQIKIDGNFMNNMVQGEATLTIKSKELNYISEYKGYFNQNSFGGFGKLTYSDKSTYIGFFVSGERSGKGTYTYSCGKKKYRGEWLNDKPHGKGTLSNDNEDESLTLTGTWDRGVYVSSSPLTCSLNDIHSSDYCPD